jgi:CDP-diacylglycerol--glycerol-3-phosphate 3-phosphatidyltransferase
MLTFPNLLSFSRIPLAFVFFSTDPLYRLVALILALISDGLDGFVARRYQATSRLGTVLDPIADKIFVVIVFAILFSEHRLELWQIAAMFSRDIALLFFGSYLMVKDQFRDYQFKAFWCGKFTTALQFALLLGIILNFVIPLYMYGMFVLLGVGSFIELLYRPRAEFHCKN